MSCDDCQHAIPSIISSSIGIRDTHVVGGLAQVTEGRDGEGDGLVNVLGELLGAAEGLGDVGGERGRHCEEAVEDAATCGWRWMVLGEWLSIKVKTIRSGWS